MRRRLAHGQRHRPAQNRLIGGVRRRRRLRRCPEPLADDERELRRPVDLVPSRRAELPRGRAGVSSPGFTEGLANHLFASEGALISGLQRRVS